METDKAALAPAVAVVQEESAPSPVAAPAAVPEGTAATTPETFGSPLLEIWYRPVLRTQLLSCLFAALCVLVFATKLIWENWLPDPIPQEPTIDSDLQRLQNLMVSGKIVGAKGELIDYTAAHPDNASAHALLGRAYREVGSYSKAFKEIKIAVALDPQNLHYRFLLATLNTDIGWFQDGLAVYSEILDIAPDNMQALAGRLEINFLLQRTNELVADADFAVRAHPNDAKAHMLRGNAMFGIGRLEDAMTAYGNVMQLGNKQEREVAQDLVGQVRQLMAQQQQQQRLQQNK